MSSRCPGKYQDPDSASQLDAHGLPRRVLFLDRDGVINHDGGYVHDATATAWMPGIFELCREAAGAGLLLVVVTNQAGIARGYYSEAQFYDYTAWMHAQFTLHDAPLLATYFCPHHPEHGIGEYLLDCDCRKPKPGMLLQAATDYQVDMQNSGLIGDKPGDITAGRAAGVAHLHMLERTGLVGARSWLHDSFMPPRPLASPVHS